MKFFEAFTEQCYMSVIMSVCYHFFFRNTIPREKSVGVWKEHISEVSTRISVVLVAALKFITNRYMKTSAANFQVIMFLLMHERRRRSYDDRLT